MDRVHTDTHLRGWECRGNSTGPSLCVLPREGEGGCFLKPTGNQHSVCVGGGGTERGGCCQVSLTGILSGSQLQGAMEGRGDGDCVAAGSAGAGERPPSRSHRAVCPEASSEGLRLKV